MVFGEYTLALLGLFYAAVIGGNFFTQIAVMISFSFYMRTFNVATSYFNCSVIAFAPAYSWCEQAPK